MTYTIDPSTAAVIKLLVYELYASQGTRIALGNQVAAMATRKIEPPPKFQACLDRSRERFEAAEKDAEKTLAGILKGIPLWSDWLIDVKGIGPRIAGVLVAQILCHRRQRYQLGDDIKWGIPFETLPEVRKEEYLATMGTPLEIFETGFECFRTPGHLHSWCGLGVVDGKAKRRQKGVASGCNEKMKLTAYKIGETFVKCGDGYRGLYADRREFERTKVDDKGKPLTDAHTFNMAKRWTAKMFLSHAWTIGRILQGLPVCEPWVLRPGDPGNHHCHYIRPIRDKGEWGGQYLQAFEKV